MFIREIKNWLEYRKLPDLLEVDFHPPKEKSFEPYSVKMDSVWDNVLTGLKQAQQNGMKYVLFTHGSSTSRMGATTARSQVRKLMRSKEATPYIIRRECIQNESVFVASIRQLEAKPQE